MEMKPILFNKEPVFMEYHWIEKDKRRDRDNICAYGRKRSYGGKFIVSDKKRRDKDV